MARISRRRKYQAHLSWGSRIYNGCHVGVTTARLKWSEGDWRREVGISCRESGVTAVMTGLEEPGRREIRQVMTSV